MRTSTVETTDSQTPDGSIEAAVEGILAPQPEAIEAEDGAAADEAVEAEYEAEEYSDEEYDAEEYEDAEEAEEPEPDLITVRVGGTERQVTLEELKQGYSGQEYVQQGMRENAEKRKEVEAIYYALTDERQKVNQALQLAQNGALQAPQPPDKSLKETDPVGYWNQKEAYEEKHAEWLGQMQVLQQTAAQQGQAQQAAQRAYLQREMETLTTLIPDFADPAKAAATRDNLVAVGTSVYGYSADEISGVMDHRAIRVLHDAAKWQQLQAGKTKAEAKAKPKSKRTVRPGAKKIKSRGAAERQTRQQLKKTGSIDDAIALMLRDQ